MAMEMVVIDGVRYDPAEADKLGIKGDRVKAAQAAVELKRRTNAYNAEVDDEGRVVDLSESNAGNGVEGVADDAGKSRRSGGTNKTAGK